MRGLLRTLAGTTFAGFALGALVGGVGSRLAMRVLFLTSGPYVRGITSDDGFVIGRFSPGDTFGLVVLGAIVGVIGAFAYLAVRPFLIGPAWLRWSTCGLAAGIVVGSMIVHTDGRDFRVLQPVWLSIGLFVAIPGLFGLLIGPAVERAIGPESWFRRAPRWQALTPLVVFGFPPLALVVGLPVLVVLGGRWVAGRWAAVGRTATHPATLWVVRSGLLVIAVAGFVSLARDALVLL